jgi:hypothetical protein
MTCFGPTFETFPIFAGLRTPNSALPPSSSHIGMYIPSRIDNGLPSGLQPCSSDIGADGFRPDRESASSERAS